MTEEQIDKYAIRVAVGNNGGEWASHYKEHHREFWRNIVRELIADLKKDIDDERRTL